MALPGSRSDREYKKFVEDQSGDVAIRVVAEDALPVSGGGAGGGNNTYSNMQGDFTATANSGAKTITLTGLPFTLAAENVVAGSAKQISSAGVVTTIPLTTVTVSGSVITVSDMSANFAAGDTVALTLVGPDKAYDSGTDAQKEFTVNPGWSHYLSETTVLTNVANATPEFVYINMEGYTGCSVHVEKTGGTDTFDVDYESSNEGDTSSVDWIDTTANWTITGGATADHIAFPVQRLRAKAHRVEITTAGASDDADFNVFVYKW